MKLTVTQNFLNCLHAYNAPKTEVEEDNPTQFTNDPDVDGGRNLITMSTGNFVNDVFTGTHAEAAQRLVRVARDCRLHRISATSNNVAKYDNTLNAISSNQYVPTLISPANIQKTMLTTTGKLFGSTRPYGIIPMPCDDDTPITVNTTDTIGNILSTANTFSSIVYNEDSSATITISCVVPSTVTTFTIKSFLFTFGAEGSSVRFNYDPTDIPPIIFAGCVLDVPMVVSAGDSFALSVTVGAEYLA